MKHIRILSLVVILAGMSSCGVSSWTTTNRTARSFVIETDIQQMPTVADLVVDTVYVRQDTTWTNTSKSYTTKAAMRDLLIGAMMEKANADVIIQPRENVTVYSKSSKQTLRMEMYGYPARYRNFRTATEQDLRVLQGLDPQPTNYNTIYIGSGAQKAPTLSPVVAAPIAKAITPAPEIQKKPKKPAYLRKPFYATIEFEWNMFFINGDRGPSMALSFNNTYLWRMRNPNIYEGFGLGLHTFSFGYDKERLWHIPLYWHNRFYFGKRKCIPFFDFRLGAFVTVREFDYQGHGKYDNIDCLGGMYYAGFLGLEFGKHVNIAVGTDQFFGAYFADADIYFNLNVCAKLGINF